MFQLNFSFILELVQGIQLEYLLQDIRTKAVSIDFSFHLDQVNDSAEVIFSNRLAIELVSVCLKTVMKVCSRSKGSQHRHLVCVIRYVELRIQLLDAKKTRSER